MKNTIIRKNLSVDKKIYYNLIEVKQDDDVILPLALFKNSVELDVTGQILKLGVNSPSGLIEQTDGFIINKNNVDIHLKNSIMELSGNLECDLEIKDASGKMTTASFSILVIKKVLNAASVQATNEFDTFIKTVAKVEADYNGLRRIIIDENNAANLQDQVNQTNEQLADNVQQLNTKINEVATTGTTIEAVQSKVDDMAQKGLIQAYTIGDETLEPRKTTFFNVIKSKNLYKEGNIAIGSFITNTGGVTGGSPTYSYTTDAIKVSEGMKIVPSYDLNGIRTQSFMRWVCAYDVNGSVLPDKGDANSSGSSLYTVPVGVDSIKITLYSNKINKLQIEENLTGTITDYELRFDDKYSFDENYLLNYAKKDELEVLKSIDTKTLNCINLCDETKLTDGACYMSGGTVIFGAMADYNYTDYMPVKTGDKVVASWGGYASSIFAPRWVVGFDKDKRVVASAYLNNSTSIKVYEVPTDVCYLIYTFGKAYKGKGIQIEVNERGVQSGYIKYFEPYSIIKDNKIINNDIDLFLPPKIYVTVGRTIELYNNQVCLQADKYHIKWDCLIGKAMKRKFSITGLSTNKGSYTLVISIIDNHFNVLATTSCELIIKDNLATNFTVCPIADSLSNGKPWECEVMTLSNNKITFVGTRRTTIPMDSNGVNKPYDHEARSGFSAGDYLKATPYTYESEGIQPFWNPTTSRFDWNNYKTTYSKTPNSVLLFLGTNNMNMDATENANHIKTIVDLIRQDEPTLPIYVCNTLFRGNQDGMGNQVNTDGYSAVNSGRYKYEEDKKVFNLMVKLYELLKNYTKLYFVPIATCHDSENNFGAIETPVNPRAIQKELLPTEATHPQNQGYYQMADIIYSAISCTNI